MRLGTLSLLIAMLCMAEVTTAQIGENSILLPDVFSVMQISATVGNGVTINHTARDLYLAVTNPAQATFILEMIIRARSVHSIAMLSDAIVVTCEYELLEEQFGSAHSNRVCSINRYMTTAIYEIALFDI